MVGLFFFDGSWKSACYSFFFQMTSGLDKQDSTLADNEIKFLDGPYEATVPEMSAEGIGYFTLPFY